MLDSDELLLLELERVRLPSPVLARIEELAEERRELLRLIPELVHHRDQALRRLAELDLELERLWDLRRRELLFVRQALSPEQPSEATTLEEVEEGNLPPETEQVSSNALEP
jgi:hypothetical protein